jgi:hypothetical protein
MLLLAPGYGFIFHQSHRVIVTTDEQEFLVAQFSAVAVLSDPRREAIELCQAISNAISNLRE